MSTTQCHDWTIQDRRRVRNLYRLGKSLNEIQSTTGVPFTTAHRWLKAAGEMRARGDGMQMRLSGRAWCTPELVADTRRRVARGESFTELAREARVPYKTFKSAMHRAGVRAQASGPGWRRSFVDPAKSRNRVRLERIARVAALRSEGFSFPEIADRMGTHRNVAHKWAKTAYGRSLTAFVYGPGKVSRKPYAVAMWDEMHLPAWFIAKVLDTTPEQVESWLAADERAKARRREAKRECEQRRRDRATAEFIDAHRDADTRPQPE
jgi:transposase